MPLGERAMQDIFRQLGIVLNKIKIYINMYRPLNLNQINGGWGGAKPPDRKISKIDVNKLCFSVIFWKFH